MHSAAPAPVLALPVPVMAAVPVAIERAALRIKIDASVTDGTRPSSRITISC